MKFNILTLFPEAFSVFFETSIIGNAVEKGIISHNVVNFRDYSESKHKRVDDYTYGGGKGMLIKPDCVYKAYDDIVLNSGRKPKMIYMSPRGKVLNQEIASSLAKEDELIILCGHYEGVDQRIIDELCDMELSIGDYVLTGGELPAMILCDCISRLIPGVLSSDESFTGESHYNGLLEYDQYTRPEIYNGLKVPDVLLSGNSKDIDIWRENNSKKNTVKMRPDLYLNKFGNLVSADDKEYYINLVLLGANSIVQDEIILQLKKNNIKFTLFNEKNIDECDFEEKTAVIVCGSYDIKLNNTLTQYQNQCVLFQNLRHMSEKRISPCLALADFNYRPANKFVTPIEFVEEIIRYCEIFDGCKDNSSPVLNNVKFICAIPYALYETYNEHFKNLDNRKIFCVTSNNIHFKGRTKIKIQNQDVDCIFYSFKSSVYGRLQFAYIDCDSETFTKLINSGSNGKLKCYI